MIRRLHNPLFVTNNRTNAMLMPEVSMYDIVI
jgi:hypothetical protein